MDFALKQWAALEMEVKNFFFFYFFLIFFAKVFPKTPRLTWTGSLNWSRCWYFKRALIWPTQHALRHLSQVWISDNSLSVLNCIWFLFFHLSEMKNFNCRFQTAFSRPEIERTQFHPSVRQRRMFWPEKSIPSILKRIYRRECHRRLT